jgi:tRNA (guanosine-2'-O-)-methyltransferase
MTAEQQIIEALNPYLTAERWTRMEDVLAWRTRYLCVVMEDIYQPQNASAVLRTCECLGVQDVHCVEQFNPYRVNPLVVRGADGWLTLRRHPSADEAVQRLRGEGYRIVATSLQPGSKPLPDFDLAAGPCAIVFGNESMGVSETILQTADEHLQIPMTGFTQSLNLSVAAGIVLYDLVGRLRNLPVGWRISTAEREELLAHWSRLSVKHADAILRRLLPQIQLS